MLPGCGAGKAAADVGGAFRVEERKHPPAGPCGHVVPDSARRQGFADSALGNAENVRQPAHGQKLTASCGMCCLHANGVELS